MSRVRAFLAFLYDFFVGDDPVIAIAVVVALAVTASVAGAGLAAWWIMPAAVAVVLGYSLRRAVR
jgi:hypothetical protein